MSNESPDETEQQESSSENSSEIVSETVPVKYTDNSSVNLLKSSSIVSAMTLLSRILGLVRDVVLANLLGASLAADVFLFAQKIPNFLRRLFAEGAFSQAFVPVLKDFQYNKSADALTGFINRIAGTLGIILLVVTFLGVFGSSAVVSLFGFGFIGNPEKFELADLLLKITFPYIFFISLTGLCGSLLNSVHRYAIPAFTPVLLNLSLISSAIIVAPLMDQPAIALAWAIFVAGILQLLLQLPFLWREGLLPKPQWGWSDPGVKRVLKLMLPAIFGVSVSQINLLIDTMIATSLITGSISWLYFSDRLLEFPLGVIGIAIATVILPNLSRKHAESSVEDFSTMIDWALRLVVLVGIPAAIGLIMLSEPLMLSLFQHGNFNTADAYKGSLSLIAYSLGLTFFMLIKILATGYYSRQDMKTPVRIGIISMVTNIVLNIALYKPFGHVGLALATSIAAAVNAILLYRGLRKNAIYQPEKGWLFWNGRLLIASLAMVATLWLLGEPVSTWQQWSLSQRIVQLMIENPAAMGAYVFSLLLLGLRVKDLRLTS
ncbi:MAG: murein biosynthesis integral membrane protein MurJ [Gammaproteobacteria bacterium]|nr:murein biosynthesis integral membrane protein MurJ [Gammaproteobacteria bacterium]